MSPNTHLWVADLSDQQHSITSRVIVKLKPYVGYRLTSALDPLITSGTMFIVQTAVLVSASKLEFATYSLAYSYVVMGQAMLAALFGGPLITLLGELPEESGRVAISEAVLRFQFASSVVTGVGGLAMAAALGLPIGIAILVVFSLIGLSFRDALRSVLAAQLQLTEALVVAIRFSLVTTLVLTVMLFTLHRIDAMLGLVALATGSLITVLRPIATGVSTRARLPSETIRRLMGMAAWSVPGAAVIWLQNSFYLTVVALSLSLDAVAEVSAGRMIVMPILITASGLLRLAQVQASRKLLNEGRDSAIRSAQRPALACLAIGGGIAVGCWMADHTIDHRLLPNGFPHAMALAGAWTTFTAATVARGFYSSLFQAMGRYREIFLLNVAILPLVIVGIIIGPRVIGLSGAVLPMAGGELLLLTFLAWKATR